MTVGSFTNGSIPPSYTVIPGYGFDSTKTSRGYAYIDDVSVVPVQYDRYIHDTSFCAAGNFDYVATSGIASAKYTWSTGDTSRSIHINTNGTYWCMAISDCTVRTDTFHVKATIVAVPDVHDTSICQFVQAPVLHIAGTGIMWHTSLSDSLGGAVQPAINTAQPGIHTFYVNTNTNGCISAWASLHIIITTLPIGNTSAKISRCDGTSALINIGAYPQKDVRYSWNTGDTEAVIMVSSVGLYIRTDSNACARVTDTIRVTDVGCDNCVHLPSGFTPNGDKRNDGFHALIRCPVSDFSLQVFNRWGQNIFSSSNQDEPWDGKQHGVDAPVGTYMYLLRYRNAVTGQEVLLKGDLSLLR